MKNKYRILFSIVCLILISVCSCTTLKEEYEFLPDWQEGYMDIHQIATGRGNAAFAILPDGTTLLIDAGDLGERADKLTQDIMPALPNDSCLPGEWIARYIKHFTKPIQRNGKLDYAFLTHFHNDHMGYASPKAKKVEGRKYVLSGITEVAEYLPIDVLVDRNWPTYDYPSREAIEKANENFENYLTFLDYQQKERGTAIACFEVGSDNQFALRYHPEKYPDFSIRNVYSAGTIWTGEGEERQLLFPLIETLEEKDYPNENICSSVIRISYNKFQYYTGGDITGMFTPDKVWRDVESAVAEVVGSVDVAVLNHHGYSDAMNETFIRTLCPQVFIMPVWDFYHPQPEPLERMLDTHLYPEERYVFATGLVESNRERLGENAGKVYPTGHIVTRVFTGGERFQMYVLDATTTDYKVIFQSDILQTKE